MDKYEFEKLQQTQLEIMDEVHRICVENNIVYYIIGGTALGAVRHGGFIPWDLDIDIAMKRPDYDRFKEVCKEQLSQRYYYRDFTNTKNFTHPHALVCINNTVLVNRFDKFNPKSENLGIYLDIFPLDVAPSNPEEQKKQKEQLMRIKKEKKLKVALCFGNSKLRDIAKRIISKAMFWTCIDKINAEFDACMRMYNNEPSELLCSMASHYSYDKQCMSQDIYGEPQLVKFSGREYYAPEQLDTYLTIIYKDYMKLPPIEEQKANLDVFEKVVFDK